MHEDYHESTCAAGTSLEETGVVGGYTTFSTFTYETLRLVEDSAWRYVGWNVALSGPLSFAAAGATYVIAKGGW